MILKPIKYLVSALLIILLLVFCTNRNNSFNLSYSVGDPIDSLNGVYVYYNGSVSNVEGRYSTTDGYNLGLKYQCVEFVKRYYYKHLGHKMPDSWGHAKSFYDDSVKDGNQNKTRNLKQYSNPSTSKPKINDLIIFDGTRWNEYGHVAIVSKVTENSVEIIQQNPGANGSSRANYEIKHKDGLWSFVDQKILGWLRK